MTQKALLQSAGDGTAVPAGYVGERIAFTSRAVTPTAGGWVATQSLVTLTPGIWLMFARVRQPNTFSLDLAVTISTNNNNDSTGSLIDGVTWDTFGADQEGGASIAFQKPLEVIHQNISTTTTYYGKVAVATGNNTPLTTIEGFAVRIA